MAFGQTVVITAFPGGEWIRQDDRWAFDGHADIQVIDPTEDEPNRCILTNLSAGGPPTGEFMMPFTIPSLPTSPPTETFGLRRPRTFEDEAGTSGIPAGKRPRLADSLSDAVEQMEEQLRRAHQLLDGVSDDIQTFLHPVAAPDAVALAEIGVLDPIPDVHIAPIADAEPILAMPVAVHDPEVDGWFADQEDEEEEELVEEEEEDPEEDPDEFPDDLSDGFPDEIPDEIPDEFLHEFDVDDDVPEYVPEDPPGAFEYEAGEVWDEDIEMFVFPPTPVIYEEDSSSEVCLTDASVTPQAVDEADDDDTASS